MVFTQASIRVTGKHEQQHILKKWQRVEMQQEAHRCSNGSNGENTVGDRKQRRKQQGQRRRQIAAIIKRAQTCSMGQMHSHRQITYFFESSFSDESIVVSVN